MEPKMPFGLSHARVPMNVFTNKKESMMISIGRNEVPKLPAEVENNEKG
jgi:hypothetical protein